MTDSMGDAKAPLIPDGPLYQQLAWPFNDRSSPRFGRQRMLLFLHTPTKVGSPISQWQWPRVHKRFKTTSRQLQRALHLRPMFVRHWVSQARFLHTQGQQVPPWFWCGNPQCDRLHEWQCPAFTKQLHQTSQSHHCQRMTSSERWHGRLRPTTTQPILPPMFSTRLWRVDTQDPEQPALLGRCWIQQYGKKLLFFFGQEAFHFRF